MDFAFDRVLYALLLGGIVLGLGLTTAGCDLLGGEGETNSGGEDESGSNEPTKIYTESEASLEPFLASSSSFGDVDNDGTLDLLITGQYAEDDLRYASRLFLGNGIGDFNAANKGLLNLDGSSSIGDVDNDGNLDLLLVGEDNDFDARARLYLGDGFGDFADVNARLQELSKASTAMGDVNNDGNLDLLITGGSTATVYLGEGDGTFEVANAGLEGVSGGSVSMGDVNDDGALDLLITGAQGDDTAGTTTLYLGNGTGDFSRASAGLEDVSQGTTAMGDVNHDGSLDLLVAGTVNGDTPETTIYLGDGEGGFTEADAGLKGFTAGASAIADVNRDGNRDLVLSGSTADGVETTLYLGNGDGTFSEAETGLEGAVFGSISLGDVDGDGDLDLLLTGDGDLDPTNEEPITTLYENQVVDDQ